ncbi:MAG: hypothetical protein ACRDJN_05115, partial [Chloroflexota bacterium]
MRQKRRAGQPRRPQRGFLPPAQASRIEKRLRPVAARLRWRRTLEQVPRALLLFAGIVLAGAVLARFVAAPGWLMAGLLVGLLVATVSVVHVARRRVGPLEAARSADATLALRERLATALELVDACAIGVLVDLQVRDATVAADRVVARRAVPVFAAGSEARRTALQRSGAAMALLLAALALALWPAAGNPIAPGSEAQKLALAETGRPEESLSPAQRAENGNPNDPAGIEGKSDRPDTVGDVAPGLVGQQQNAPGQQGQQGQQGQSNPGQQAQAEAASQQNANVAERAQALQDLGNALRQSQIARQASDSLRSGDAQRAGQQLNQVADQVNNRLSQGERQALSQAFQQAARDIGDKDQPLADASQRAAAALSQFQNQEAQQAIRDIASQVQETGQLAEAQRNLAQRAQELAQGGQPQLPQGQQGQQAGSPDGQQGNQGQQGGQGQQGQQGPRQGGQSDASATSLADLEQALR